MSLDLDSDIPESNFEEYPIQEEETLYKTLEGNVFDKEEEVIEAKRPVFEEKIPVQAVVPRSSRPVIPTKIATKQPQVKTLPSVPVQQSQQGSVVQGGSKSSKGFKPKFGNFGGYGGMGNQAFPTGSKL